MEIDESLFGKKCKYNRGNRQSGVRVWIVGLVDRSSNKLVLYPVADRTSGTLESIIERHVMGGSTIYTDSWRGYDRLNSLGYKHFSLVHKIQFKKSFKNIDTGEIVEVNTNTIEGAWKHAKDHFRRINGTSISNFESHLCEILWRNHMRTENKFGAFFSLLQSVFTLDKPPQYTYTSSSPLFDTWLSSSQDDSNTTISRFDDDIDVSSSDDGNPDQSTPQPQPMAPPSATSASTEVSGTSTFTGARQKRDATKCPPDFVAASQDGNRGRRTRGNGKGQRQSPSSSTSKTAYVTKSQRVVKQPARQSFLEWSSEDDDFES